ncbi:ATP-binding protein [Thermobifida halotolerans]|uniref:ATP-binding protein n=1 Tax=Thermobifida halotolerans TaxID=483545 RepID=A0A399G518_9ACTN|nr:ATP-binding protein [Thermobifida halotolerans]UOE20472.1 ATP-binding protein [Thermobifida halotolerans]
MSIMPHTPLPATRTAGAWPCRIYPGDLAHASRVRAEVHADLACLPHLSADLVDAVELCASEAFANAVAHTRSGQAGGRVVRALTRPTPDRLRLAVVDDGTPDTAPRIPRDRTAAEWAEAETGRGLLLIAALAAAWGTRPVVAFPGCAHLGTVVWAEFALTPEETAR